MTLKILNWVRGQKEGLMGYLREKKPEWFGEIVDDKDRKAQISLD
jgi:branched-chain amino acid transport system permease protein